MTLKVSGLSATRSGRIILHPTSLRIEPSERIGLVGASGSGKSTLGHAVIDDLRRQGARVSHVPQSPDEALDPLRSMGFHWREAERALGMAPGVVDKATLFGALNIEKGISGNDHGGWSRGMQQRFVIAMALMGTPDLIVLDEPTSALDPVVAAASMDLLNRHLNGTRTAMLLITHDLGLAARRVTLDGNGRRASRRRSRNPRHSGSPAKQSRTRLVRTSQLGSIAVLSVDRIRVTRARRDVLRDISFTLAPKRSLAIVGESGAGKSSLIAAILGLLPTQSGNITWDGAPVSACRPSLVMQEPRAAFNPVHSLRHSVLEPIRAQGSTVPNDRLARLCNGLELDPDILNRRPNEVSIGQAQRAGILRALIAAPPLVLFDEPLSALDAVTQKHTARLIAELQREEGFAALIVTHDLGYAVAFTDEIAVLKSGQMEEIASAEAFARAPQSQYGKTLRDAAIALGALEVAV